MPDTVTAAALGNPANVPSIGWELLIKVIVSHGEGL